jgi:hypothetical protein
VDRPVIGLHPFLVVEHEPVPVNPSQHAVPFPARSTARMGNSCFCNEGLLFISADFRTPDDFIEYNTHKNHLQSN